MKQTEEIQPHQAALEAQERQFQESPFNRLIYQHKEQVLAAFQHQANKYLLDYLNELKAIMVHKLIYKESEKENADVIRGGIYVLDSFLTIPKQIEGRMEREKQFKERSAAIGREG